MNALLSFVWLAVMGAPVDRGPVPVASMSDPAALVRESRTPDNQWACSALPLTTEHARDIAKKQCALRGYSQSRCGNEVSKLVRVAQSAATFWVVPRAGSRTGVNPRKWTFTLDTPQGAFKGKVASVVTKPELARQPGPPWQAVAIVRFPQPPAYFGRWQMQCIPPKAVGAVARLGWDFLAADGTLPATPAPAAITKRVEPGTAPATPALAPSCQRLAELMHSRCERAPRPPKCHKAAAKTIARFPSMDEAACARAYASQRGR